MNILERNLVFFKDYFKVCDFLDFFMNFCLLGMEIQLSVLLHSSIFSKLAR